MDYGFSKEQEMLKKAARQFAETKVAPKVLEVDEKGEFPFDLSGRWDKWVSSGWSTPRNTVAQAWGTWPG